MRRQAFLPLLLLAASTARSFAAGGDFEKTIPVPRSGDAKLNWTYAKCSVRSLTLRNYPDREEIEKARREDPGDTSWLWWEFNVDNRGDRKCKIKLWLEVLDKQGDLVKAGDRSDTVGAGELDDDIRISTRMKTLAIADAPRVRIRAEIRTK